MENRPAAPVWARTATPPCAETERALSAAKGGDWTGLRDDRELGVVLVVRQLGEFGLGQLIHEL